MPISAHAEINGCADYPDPHNDSYEHRLCPGGISFIRRYQYFGLWGEWTMVKKENENARQSEMSGTALTLCMCAPQRLVSRKSSHYGAHESSARRILC